MTEVVAISHSTVGTHKSLINGFPHTKTNPFEQFLRWQRLNVLESPARDEDL